jgi:hypothetical protein
VDHSKTGPICPVFEWFGCHFAFQNRTQKVSGTWPFENRTVRFSNGYCSWPSLSLPKTTASTEITFHWSRATNYPPFPTCSIHPFYGIPPLPTVILSQLSFNSKKILPSLFELPKFPHHSYTDSFFLIIKVLFFLPVKSSFIQNILILNSFHTTSLYVSTCITQCSNKYKS